MPNDQCVRSVGQSCRPDGKSTWCGVTLCNGYCDPGNCREDCVSETGDSCGECGLYACDGSCDDPCAGDGGCDPNMGYGCGACGTYDCYGSCGDPCAGGGGGGGGGGDDPCGGCNPGYSCVAYGYAVYCEMEDPILIDLSGDGFALTSVQNGVPFDFFGTGKPIRTSWTSAGSDQGWLVLDRNQDGRIGDGSELFSNLTPQPGKAATHLGFKALDMYDQPQNGGNHDGWIDQQDAVFSKLRVWVDKNHNGAAESKELVTLKEAGITAISVRYKDSKWVDAYGNQFRYRTEIVRDKANRDKAKANGKGKWAYDVILVYAPAK